MQALRMKRVPRSLDIAEIAEGILVVRGHKVILDTDLASLYGVATKRLNEQVKRNATRFPEDFMFRLTRVEAEDLNRSQIATGSGKHRDPRFPPFAFTEHGALMAASVLNTERATEVAIFVVRAFVQLRATLGAHKQLAKRLDELEASIESKLAARDRTIADILAAIRGLMMPPEAKRRPIGFVVPKE